MRRPLLAFCVAAACLAAAPAANAAVTIGQLGTPIASSCSSGISWAQPTVTSGTGFVATVNGTITSWSSNTGAGSDLRLKVFRRVSGNSLVSVGRSEIGTLSSGINSFPASIPIAAGDMIGVYTVDGSSCLFNAPGDAFLYRGGDLAEDGVAGLFTSGTGYRLSLSANIAPTNTFSLGRITRSKRKGTARIAVRVSNPGKLVASGNGVAGRAAAPGAGKVQLKIKAKGKKKRRLNAAGKVTVKPKIAFTPSGGAARTQSLKLKLRKN